VIEKALHFNPNNADLMKLFLETIPNVHSSENVMKLIKELIAKDPYNFTFWRHLLNNHQSSMSCDAESALKTPTTESIFYLQLASKYREMKYKHRIYNAIDGLVSRRSSVVSSVLTWRMYLRAAFNFDFTKCKRSLYQILDRQPMMKQLYLDGARYLPGEHSQLLDLIVEKGLRAHALAEELEILRTQPSS
jgi:hypothetical protein